MSDAVFKTHKAFKLKDALLILFCLCVAAAAIYLFMLDLNQTINSRSEEPVGTIIIKNNTVQRRAKDRILWDRLFVESPVYAGDVIRVADLSAATLNMDSSEIDISENTLIRVQRSLNTEETFQIELSQGNMDLRTGNEKITLNIMGQVISAGPSTVLVAEAAETGLSMKVSSGKVEIFEEGREAPREILAGSMIAMDAGGTERIIPAVIIREPRSDARYLKTGSAPVPVGFSWNRINMENSAALRLEIAEDRNFSSIVNAIGNLGDRANTSLNSGVWHWRLSLENTVLANGQITITEAGSLTLISPANNSVIRYQTDPQPLRFQWSEISEASYYTLEASDNPGFSNPKIRIQTAATSFVYTENLGSGNWYWRVRPAFPSVYAANATAGTPFSPAASFRMEQGEALTELPWPVVEASVMEIPPPPVVAAPVVTPPRPAPAPAPRPAPRPAPAPAPQPRVTTAPPVVAPPVVAPPPPEPIVIAPPVIEPPVPEPPVVTPPVTTPPVVTPPAARPALLPAPASQTPAPEHRIGIEDLRTNRSIDFTWSPVPEATSYILTILQVTPGGRRLIIRNEIENRNSWTLENLSILDRGTFVWQVEAITKNRSGSIVRRGDVAQSSFVLDIPVPTAPSIFIDEAD